MPKIIVNLDRKDVMEIGYREKSTGQCKLETYLQIYGKYEKVLTQTAEKGSDLDRMLREN